MVNLSKEELIEVLRDYAYHSWSLGEASCTVFTRNDGLFIDPNTGVAYAPSWRGDDMQLLMERARDDTDALLAKGYQLNPSAMPRNYQANEPAAPPQPSTTSSTANHANGTVYAQFPAGYIWEPTTDETIKTVLKVHQDSLSKKENTASQIARYVAGCKVGSYEGKRVLTFVNKAGDAIFAPMWEDPSAEAWKSPFDKGKGWSSEFMETANALAFDRFKGIIRFNGFCSFKLNEDGKKDKNGLLYASFYKVLGVIEGWQVVE